MTYILNTNIENTEALVVSSKEIDTMNQLQISDVPVCISHSPNTLEKGTNPTILPPATSKYKVWLDYMKKIVYCKAKYYSRVLNDKSRNDCSLDKGSQKCILHTIFLWFFLGNFHVSYFPKTWAILFRSHHVYPRKRFKCSSIFQSLSL